MRVNGFTEGGESPLLSLTQIPPNLVKRPEAGSRVAEFLAVILGGLLDRQ